MLDYDQQHPSAEEAINALDYETEAIFSSATTETTHNHHQHQIFLEGMEQL